MTVTVVILKLRVMVPQDKTLLVFLWKVTAQYCKDFKDVSTLLADWASWVIRVVTHCFIPLRTVRFWWQLVIYIRHFIWSVIELWVIPHGFQSYFLTALFTEAVYWSTCILHGYVCWYAPSWPFSFCLSACFDLTQYFPPSLEKNECLRVKKVIKLNMKSKLCEIN